MATAKADIDAREAKHGHRMIELRVRFWTNGIADEDNKIIPKHALSSGVVRVHPNPAHGIQSGKSQPFRSLLGLNAAIEKVLIEHGIKLHPNRQSQRYIVDKVTKK